MATSRTTPRAPLSLGPASLCALLLLPTAACKDDEPAADAGTDGTGATDTDTDSADGTETLPDDALTWWRDIEPIVRDKCANCHRPGEVAPFPLDTYEDFVTYGPAAIWAIEQDVMPPWGPDDACNQYADPLSLEPEHKDQLLAYLATDMPQGDPEDAPPADPPPPELVPDVMLEMPQSYTPDASTPDDYRCFLIPMPEDMTEEQFMTGFEVYPGERAIVHHVIAFQIDPGNEGPYVDLDAADPEAGYTCFGGPGMLDGSARWLGAWVPGVGASIAPEGVGQRILPGSTIVFQVHYNTVGNAGLSDRSAIGLRLQPSVDRPAVLMPLADLGWLTGTTSMLIPAGDANVTHEATMDRTHPVFLNGVLPGIGAQADDDLIVWTAGLHMHLFGTRGRLTVRDSGGGNEQCMLDVPEWDFDWQSSYALAQPITWTADQELHLQCWWDNSAENQPVVDGIQLDPVDRNWGDGTLDEMCLGILYVSAAE
ncbi:monooxygenase [Paraliomyxa miuraensis]|uniref:monooxygenase n=1 Tax=Paraliomyxa miuraensis TaxID=376150 RepID=UPI002251E27D|nr:monooxygenase [Paraliomyxa miuraensis]MCX4247365.1 cytochrome c [Paraliomyxa miuraensis]